MISIRVFTFLVSFILFFGTLTGQDLSPLTFDFRVNNTVIKNPLTGGINTPQVSNADFNNDGLLDLFVFDRSGNVSIVYLNDGIANQPEYTYAPRYAENFPDLVDWVLLRDFNQDGAMDIFTAARTPGISGVEVLRGYYEDNELKFAPFYFPQFQFNVIPFRLTNGSFTNLYVSSQDLPAIDDIDGDGDLDIISFGVNGGYMEYFTNQSVEDGFGVDSLLFDQETDCFGGIFEDGLSTCVCLPIEPGACCTGATELQGDTRHAGSTILTFDNDGDGDKEVVLGDISFDALTFLENGGNSDMATMVEQDCNYPSTDVPVDLASFPASFYVDVNNDGKRDLLAAPNSPRRVEDYFNLWYYRNDGTDAAPNFNFQRKDLLTHNTIDMGSGSSPVFVDFDQDGLKDIIVGTNTFYQPFNERDPRLFLYRNTGTLTEPVFTLFDDDYLNFSQYNSNAWGFAPTFGDLDGDGDLDMMVGYQNGSLFYGENTAGAGNTFQFTITPNYLGIDVGQNSTPTLVDINRDGALDLVIGERNGNLNYLPNIGTPTNPIFQPVHTGAPNNPFFGEVDVAAIGFDSGMSAPYFVDFDGSYTLFCGSYRGNIYRYDNIENNLDGAFNLVDDTYGDNVRVGEESRISITDINGDEVLDVLLGNFRGGLNLYQTDLNIDGSVGTQNLSEGPAFRVLPNPATDYVELQMEAFTGQLFDVAIYDLLGRTVYNRAFNGETLRINTKDFGSGIYFCKISIDGKESVKKLIVN